MKTKERQPNEPPPASDAQPASEPRGSGEPQVAEPLEAAGPDKTLADASLVELVSAAHLKSRVLLKTVGLDELGRVEVKLRICMDVLRELPPAVLHGVAGS